MKQTVYTNRIKTILEEKKEFNESDKHFFKELQGFTEESLTEHQKERINMIYVGL